MASITPAVIFTFDDMKSFPSLGTNKKFPLSDKSTSDKLKPQLNFAAAAAAKPEDIPMVEKFIINAHAQVIESTDSHAIIDIPDWLHVHFLNKLGDTCDIRKQNVDKIQKNICGKVISHAALREDVEHTFFPNVIIGSTMENYIIFGDKNDPKWFDSNVLRCFNDKDNMELILNLDKLGGLIIAGKGMKPRREKDTITLREIIEMIRRVKKTDDVHLYCLFCRGF